MKDDFITNTVDGAMSFQRMHNCEYDPHEDRHRDDDYNDTYECPLCGYIAPIDEWELSGYSSIIECPQCNAFFEL